MSLRIEYDERAISQAAAFLDDPPGLREVLDAIDRLADDPRPAGSFPYGSPHRRRGGSPAHRPRHRRELIGAVASRGRGAPLFHIGPYGTGNGVPPLRPVLP